MGYYSICSENQNWGRVYDEADNTGQDVVPGLDVYSTDINSDQTLVAFGRVTGIVDVYSIPSMTLFDTFIATSDNSVYDLCFANQHSDWLAMGNAGSAAKIVFVNTTTKESRTLNYGGGTCGTFFASDDSFLISCNLVTDDVRIFLCDDNGPLADSNYNFSASTAGTVYSGVLSPNDDVFVVMYQSSPYLSAYKITTTSSVRMTVDNGSAGLNIGLNAQFSADGTKLYVATIPNGLREYLVTGDAITFNRTVIDGDTGYRCLSMHSDHETVLGAGNLITNIRLIEPVNLTVIADATPGLNHVAQPRTHTMSRPKWGAVSAPPYDPLMLGRPF